MKFTGFLELTGPETEQVLTTIGPVELDELLARVKTRIEEAPPGTSARVDLIAEGVV